MDDEEPKSDDGKSLIENRKSGKKDVLKAIGSIGFPEKENPVYEPIDLGENSPAVKNIATKWFSQHVEQSQSNIHERISKDEKKC